MASPDMRAALPPPDDPIIATRYCISIALSDVVVKLSTIYQYTGIPIGIHNIDVVVYDVVYTTVIIYI